MLALLDQQPAVGILDGGAARRRLVGAAGEIERARIAVALLDHRQVVERDGVLRRAHEHGFVFAHRLRGVPGLLVMLREQDPRRGVLGPTGEPVAAGPSRGS